MKIDPPERAEQFIKVQTRQVKLFRCKPNCLDGNDSTRWSAYIMICNYKLTSEKWQQASFPKYSRYKSSVPGPESIANCITAPTRLTAVIQKVIIFIWSPFRDVSCMIRSLWANKNFWVIVRDNVCVWRQYFNIWKWIGIPSRKRHSCRKPPPLLQRIWFDFVNARPAFLLKDLNNWRGLRV